MFEPNATSADERPLKTFAAPTNFDGPDTDRSITNPAPSQDAQPLEAFAPKRCFFASQRRRILCSLLTLGLLVFAATLLINATSTDQVAIVNTITLPANAKWSPKFWMGNLDEPMPPPDYYPNDPHRVESWLYCRNPAHNFNFYVIGIADKKFYRAGRFPADNFNPDGGWNWTVCRYGWMRLPFISYCGHGLSCYLGWRDRGNFGLKINYPSKDLERK